MAAILPHLAEPDETSPIEEAYATCVGSLSGLNLGHDNPACPTPEAVLADSHAGLVALTFARDAVIQGLQGRQFVTQAGNKDDKDKRKVFLVLDCPPDRAREGTCGVGPGPAWNPSTSANVQQYQLLSWTSKMNAPSWSIPAGAPEIGGSCPGARAGQTVVPLGMRRREEKFVARGLGEPAGTQVNLAQAICQMCYATGGQYSTGHVQFAQVLRYLWLRQAISVPATAPDGSPSTVFIETMTYAVANANYRLDGGTVEEVDESGKKNKRFLPPEPTGRRFFRIHDSGDFFSPEYLAQWKQIADRLPDVTFWAPSRIWATPWGTEAVNEVNRDPRNLIIRPSAYEINERGPVGGRPKDPANLGLGWAATTTVIHVNQNQGMTASLERHVTSLEGKPTHRLSGGPDRRYDWDCRAYATEDQGHTCRKAVAPPGLAGPNGKGCRACWIAPDMIVNYSLH